MIKPICTFTFPVKFVRSYKRIISWVSHSPLEFLGNGTQSPIFPTSSAGDSDAHSEQMCEGPGQSSMNSKESGEWHGSWWAFLLLGQPEICVEGAGDLFFCSLVISTVLHLRNLHLLSLQPTH